MKTILMTGAAGRIGTFLRPELAGKYRLRLSDVKPIRDLRPGESFVRADIYRGGGHCMAEGGTRSPLAGTPEAKISRKRRRS
jgi:nucleoside-diphosphate-sugar epimerase